MILMAFAEEKQGTVGKLTKVMSPSQLTYYYRLNQVEHVKLTRLMSELSTAKPPPSRTEMSWVTTESSMVTLLRRMVQDESSTERTVSRLSCTAAWRSRGGEC